MENNKEEIIKRFMATVDDFYNRYPLAENMMSDGDWNALYDVLSNHLKENDFEPALNILIRRAFNMSLFANADNFTLYYIILALKDLCAFNIKPDEIETIKNEIMFQSLKSRVKVKSKTTQ